jgi:hypothetical protein
MKGQNNKRNQILKAVLVVAAIVGWAAIPFLNRGADAAGIPILVRTANLVAPSGSVNPHGLATYQLYADGNRELEVEIEDVNLPAGTSLAAVVDGVTVGQIILAADQRGRLKLRTEDGQTVPVTNDGSTVQVLNGSTVLVSGVLNGGGPNPTPSPTGSPSPSPTGSPTGTPGPSPSPTGSPNEFGLFAGLSGPTINGVLPGGYAEFEVHSSRLELEVRVRQVNLPAGTQLAVSVNTTAVGNLFLESGGEGRLRLRTDNGQTVPQIVAGDTITLRLNSTTILSGTFAGFTGPSPSPSPTGTPGPTPSPSPSLGRSFESHLTGAGVQPPVQTAATGEIKVTLNAAETQASIFGEFHNLGSNQTGARIESMVGDTTVVHDLGVVGGQNGNFATVTINVSAAQVQQLRTGLWSAVITSVNNPAGEIRGTFIARSNRADFDGDGSNDIAVFRPSTGTWYSLNGSGFASQTQGTAGDRVVSADYDGDGKTDAATLRFENNLGRWEIRRSSDAGTTVDIFGVPGDIPVRGDYDGDGRSDIAVYRPSTGFWYIKTTSDFGFKSYHFGEPGDLASPADMDGDGKDDVVVFRPSTGMWYWLGSSNGGFAAVHFGETGDVPVRGDFEGDGKADYAVFRPTTGMWYILHSSGIGFRAVHFGVNGDVPVAGNYDADRQADIAVFRPSTGMWYILRSAEGAFQQAHFGVEGDIPAVAR